MTPAGELRACLRRVRSLRFVARSGGATGWDGVGVGAVEVDAPDEYTLVFTESGEWHPQAGRVTPFRNVFRWSLLGADAIRLEHLRLGPDQPVALLDLVPGPGGAWSSASPHRCGADAYSAELYRQGPDLLLQWSIDGPAKSERIEYRYSRARQETDAGVAAQTGRDGGGP
ncbi:MAG: DUF6314 family protein [Halofilum sp. (in: g-proteobacteria)]|nr:DUF6314 family protein [Halofilum sp. (in: g-proteobacteria)]